MTSQLANRVLDSNVTAWSFSINNPSLKLQNNNLTHSLEELNSLVLTIKGQTDEERQKVEAKHQHVHEERKQAEDERRRAEERE